MPHCSPASVDERSRIQGFAGLKVSGRLATTPGSPSHLGLLPWPTNRLRSGPPIQALPRLLPAAAKFKCGGSGGSVGPKMVAVCSWMEPAARYTAECAGGQQSTYRYESRQGAPRSQAMCVAVPGSDV